MPTMLGPFEQAFICPCMVLAASVSILTTDILMQSLSYFTTFSPLFYIYLRIPDNLLSSYFWLYWKMFQLDKAQVPQYLQDRNVPFDTHVDQVQQTFHYSNNQQYSYQLVHSDHDQHNTYQAYNEVVVSLPQGSSDQLDKYRLKYTIKEVKIIEGKFNFNLCRNVLLPEIGFLCQLVVHCP